MSTHQPFRVGVAAVKLAVVGGLILSGIVLVATVEDAPQAQTTLSQRTGRMANYPCAKCHEGIEAQLEEQPAAHRRMTFKHFEAIKDCTLCHNKDDMNTLKLTSGTVVSFDESQKLCGQCHGEKWRDWRTGGHGKHVGNWKGAKTRLLCTDCHDPHTPGMATVEAKPGPPFPKFGIRKRGHQ